MYLHVLKKFLVLGLARSLLGQTILNFSKLPCLQFVFNNYIHYDSLMMQQKEARRNSVTNVFSLQAPELSG